MLSMLCILFTKIITIYYLYYTVATIYEQSHVYTVQFGIKAIKCDVY